jgi:hypothetical protein
MANYKQITLDQDNPEINPKIIIRKSDNAFIPVDLNNVDYQEYLEWVEEGNTIEPADE